MEGWVHSANLAPEATLVQARVAWRRTLVRSGHGEKACDEEKREWHMGSAGLHSPPTNSKMRDNLDPLTKHEMKPTLSEESTQSTVSEPKRIHSPSSSSWGKAIKRMNTILTFIHDTTRTWTSPFGRCMYTAEANYSQPYKAYVYAYVGPIYCKLEPLWLMILVLVLVKTMTTYTYKIQVHKPYACMYVCLLSVLWCRYNTSATYRVV
jgi:hypothetical protein